jgi:hypothetical protein
MPGFKKDDIEIEAQDDSIAITGKMGWKYDEKKPSIHMQGASLPIARALSSTHQSTFLVMSDFNSLVTARAIDTIM